MFVAAFVVTTNPPTTSGPTTQAAQDSSQQATPQGNGDYCIIRKLQTGYKMDCP